MAACIGVAGSFSEGGQPFCPAKIQSFPAKIQSFPANIFSCQGGQVRPILFCRAKLLCQTVLPIGKHAVKLSKLEEKQENMTETNQKWQKTDKNDRKTFKMLSITNYLRPSFPFLSCQASISVLPSSLFCPAKLMKSSLVQVIVAGSFTLLHHTVIIKTQNNQILMPPELYFI